MSLESFDLSLLSYLVFIKGMQSAAEQTLTAPIFLKPLLKGETNCSANRNPHKLWWQQTSVIVSHLPVWIGNSVSHLSQTLQYPQNQTHHMVMVVTTCWEIIIFRWWESTYVCHDFQWILPPNHYSCRACLLDKGHTPFPDANPLSMNNKAITTPHATCWWKLWAVDGWQRFSAEKPWLDEVCL